MVPVLCRARLEGPRRNLLGEACGERERQTEGVSRGCSVAVAWLWCGCGVAVVEVAHRGAARGTKRKA